MDDWIEDLIATILKQREQIIASLICRYGYEPDEIEQVVEWSEHGIKWFVRKKLI